MAGVHRTIYPVEVSDHHMQVRPSQDSPLDGCGSGISLAYGFPGLYRMVAKSGRTLKSRSFLSELFTLSELGPTRSTAWPCGSHGS